MDQFRAKVLLEQKRNQLHLESFMRHDNIQKSQPEDINPFDKFEEDIQKGKKASIGETRVWNGKKVKKVAEGKWVEVSETHNMSKKEHEQEIKYYQKVEENKGNEVSDRRKAQDEQDKHHKLASKLSDKEYTDEEIERMGEKVLEEPKYKIGSTYHLPAPEGGEAVDMKIISFKDNQYKVETSNEEGRKGLHTFSSEIVEELVNLSKGESGDAKSKLANHYNVSPERLKDLKLDGTDTPLELSRALNLPIDDTNFQGVQETIKKMMGSNKKQE